MHGLSMKKRSGSSTHTCPCARLLDTAAGSGVWVNPPVIVQFYRAFEKKDTKNRQIERIERKKERKRTERKKIGKKKEGAMCTKEERERQNGGDRKEQRGKIL